MHTYHTTVKGTKVWIKKSVMAYTVAYPLKNHENIQKLDIDDISMLQGIGLIVQDGTIERQEIIPLANEIEAVGKKVVLYFNPTKVAETCEKQTFCEGWFYPSCECCVEDFEMTEDEFDPDNEQYRLEETNVKYLIPIPSVRLTVSY